MYVRNQRKGDFRGNYIPETFEAMMESFGIKLQRKALQEDYFDCYRALEPMMKKRNNDDKALSDKVSETGQKMIDLLQLSSVEPCSLKNQHNQLFLSLMQNLKYQDNLNKVADKLKLKFMSKIKHTHGSESDSNESEDDELKPLDHIH